MGVARGHLRAPEQIVVDWRRRVATGITTTVGRAAGDVMVLTITYVTAAAAL